jgi:ribosomal protein L7/L12
MIHAGELLNGSSKKPTNIEVSVVGVGIGTFKRTMHPWSTISDVTIDGPSSNTSRVTATRLVTLGVFALAAKKSTSETLAIITLTSGQVITVMFTKKSEPEVRAIFAPHLGRIAKRAEPAPSTIFNPVQTPNPILAKSKTEQLTDLGELLEKGLISESEFLDLKSEILNVSIDQVVTTPTVEDNTSVKYVSINITKSGPQQIQGIKIVRENTGLGLRESKDVIDSIPCQVPGEYPQAIAQGFINELQKWGYQAVIVGEEVTEASTNSETESQTENSEVVTLKRRPTDRTAIQITKWDSTKREAVLDVIGSTIRQAPDKKTAKKWRQSYEETLNKIDETPAAFAFNHFEAKRIINDLEKCGCEVGVWVYPPGRLAKKGSYEFIELEEHEDPFDVTDLLEFVGVGIAKWNGQNKSEILRLLSEATVWSAISQTRLDQDKLPDTTDRWIMDYGTSIDIFRKIEALGAVGKRFGKQDARSQELYRNL